MGFVIFLSLYELLKAEQLVYCDNKLLVYCDNA